MKEIRRNTFLAITAVALLTFGAVACSSTDADTTTVATAMPDGAVNAGATSVSAADNPIDVADSSGRKNEAMQAATADASWSGNGLASSRTVSGTAVATTTTVTTPVVTSTLTTTEPVITTVDTTATPSVIIEETTPLVDSAVTTVTTEPVVDQSMTSSATQETTTTTTTETETTTTRRRMRKD